MHSLNQRQNTAEEHSGELLRPLAVTTKGIGVAERQKPDFQARESAVIEEVTEAIATLGRGRPVCFGAYPDGVYRRVTPLQSIVGKGGRDEGVVCEVVRYDGAEQKHILSLPVLSLVYFPAAHDVGAYFKAGAFSQFSGPSEFYPGSVGMLQMLYHPQKHIAQVVALQSSVIHSKERVRDLLNKADNNLANRYFRWRYHLLDQAFAFTRREGISRIAIGPSNLQEFPLTAMTRNHEIISEKALKNGFKLSRDRSHLIDQLGDSEG